MELKFFTEWEIGAHTLFKKNIFDTLYNSINMGMYTTQFFMGSPQSFTRAKIEEKDIKKCIKLLERFPLNVFTHYPYLANLAGSKDCLAWSGNDSQDEKTMTVIKNLEYELGVLSNFNKKRSGVVIHPGNNERRNDGLKTIAKSINKINFSEFSKLLLENSSGQGTTLATTLEELKTILDNVNEEKRENIGICLDTCHMFAYGLYDLRLVSEVDKLFSDFEEKIGLDKLILIHLNDSKTPFGKKTDRHELLCCGHIWSESSDSLIHLLNKCKQYNIPLVLETHCSDMNTICSFQ